MSEATCQLSDGFHFLGLSQGTLGASLLRDVDRMDKTADHVAVRSDIGNQRAPGVASGPGLIGERVFVGDLFAVEARATAAVTVSNTCSPMTSRIVLSTIVSLLQPNHSA